MKKIFLLFVIMFYYPTYSSAVVNLCCDELYVTTNMTDSCCIDVTLHNPECITPLVKFYQWNSAANEYETVESITINADSTATHTYCPMNKDGFIKYRIRVMQSNNPDKPMCPGSNDIDEFVEGRTQFTDSIECIKFF